MNPLVPPISLLGLLLAASPAHATSRAARVALEAGGGVVGTAVGALGVGGLAYVVTPSEEHDCHGHFCLGLDDGMALLGGLAGGVAGLGTGVYVAGTAADGHGAYWAAMAGEGAGFAASASLFGIAWFCDEYGLDPCTDVMEPLALIGLFTLPIAGSVVGYEWSSEVRGPSSGAASAPQAMLGWSGTF